MSVTPLEMVNPISPFDDSVENADSEAPDTTGEQENADNTNERDTTGDGEPDQSFDNNANSEPVSSSDFDSGKAQGSDSVDSSDFESSPDSGEAQSPDSVDSSDFESSSDVTDGSSGEATGSSEVTEGAVA